MALEMLCKQSLKKYESRGETRMINLVRTMWSNDVGQDIAEYAVMLAVILIIVIGTIKLIGTQANTVFSETASALQ
jgi:Flp pilus assembly pilin Flp